MQGKILRTAGLVGVVALLLGAGGATAAQLLTGADIKNGSITGKDIRNKSLTPKDFRGSVQGPQGERGPQGPAGTGGAAGAAGPRGAAGATNVNTRIGPVDNRTSTVFCAAGERTVGGGGFTADASAFLYDSSPVVVAGNALQGWTASAETTAGNDASVQAYVVCAAP